MVAKKSICLSFKYNRGQMHVCMPLVHSYEHTGRQYTCLRQYIDLMLYPANIHVLVQRWSLVGTIAVGCRHYDDGKPSVHSIGCNDSTNNLLNIYLISPDMA